MKTEHFEDWSDSITSQLTAEILETIKQEPNVYSSDAMTYVTNQLITKLVGMHIYNALTVGANKKNKRDAYAQTKESFNQAKNNLQDGIAMAFAEAWHMFAGREIEYYCQIKTVPEVQTDKLS